jgi:hypothetical protein
MKKMFLTLLIIFSILALTACSEENTSSLNGNRESELTGEKFVDAAATKIMLYNEGMNRKTANCVVKFITADGQIGVGEINQMHLTSKTMPQNSERLNKSYSAAIQACQ